MTVVGKMRQSATMMDGKPPFSEILLVVAAYYPDSYGGAERQAAILAEALARMGITVTLVAPTVSETAPTFEKTSFGQIERLRVTDYPNNGGRRILSFVKWTIWFRNRYGARAGVPIYVFHARLHALGPALAALRTGAPLLIKLGGGGEASDFAALRAKRFLYGHMVLSYLLRKVDCFVANGAQIVKDLRDEGVEERRIAAFPNGVELPPQEVFEDAQKSRDGRTFIYAGRLLPDKRPGVLFDATMALARAGHRPLFVVLGEGSERERLQAEAGRLGQSAAVDFRGYTTDVYPALMQSDFFVSASMREGQSNALLEAMSAGVIPIIYGASGSDVVRHGVNGFLVPVSEPHAFEAAMREAMAMTPERRAEMSTAARRFAEEQIGIDSVARRTVAEIAARMTPAVERAPVHA